MNDSAVHMQHLCLEVAQAELSAKTLVVSLLLSAGVFRRQRELSTFLRIAIQSACDHSYDELEEVTLMAYTSIEQITLAEEFEKLNAFYDHFGHAN